ncbi:MAG: hypothetical protein HXX17_03900 [Geobacteraceae bacterium]|nr:hypothetical protein [Geobacteraceae bacterium]
MKTRLFATSLFLFAIGVSSGNVFAAHKIATVHGILGTTSKGKSLLITSGENGYYFDPSSAAGRKILSTCQTGNDCIVRGVIDGRRILNAFYVKAGR